MTAAHWVLVALPWAMLVALVLRLLARREHGPARATGAPGITVLAIPPLKGERYIDYDGRYRLWTAEHGLDFDAVPHNRDGGPSKATLNGWITSTSALDWVMSSASVVAADDGMHTLDVWRGDPANPERHPLDGTKYPTQDDADRAAYNAGVTAFMVYERDARRFNLPTR